MSPRNTTRIAAYLHTQGRRLFRKLSVQERAGKWLYESIENSDAPVPQRALVLALRAGDIDAALVLANELVSDREVVRGSQPPAAIAGLIDRPDPILDSTG